jgi:hypothetical protein
MERSHGRRPGTAAGTVTHKGYCTACRWHSHDGEGFCPEYGERKVKKSPDATGKTYFVLGPLCWGHGSSIDEAEREAKKNKPKGQRWKLVALYEADPGVSIWVDSFGGVHWNEKDGARRISKTSDAER